MKSNGNKAPESMSPDEASSPVREDIQQMSTYETPPRYGMVKLDSMENPYPLSEALRIGLGGALAGVNVNRYPSTWAEPLKGLLALHSRFVGGREVILGNGSDELIQILVMACCGGAATEHSVMGVDPGFSMYERITRVVGAKWKSVPLTADFRLNLKLTLAEIKQHRPRLFFLASPHNPTGGMFSLEEVLAIAKAMEGLGWFVLDEAYQSYSHPTLHIDYAFKLGKMPHVLQMRTLSKLGMAGLRLGYLLGAPGHIKHLEKVRLPYNVNAYTQVAAAYILEHGQNWMRDVAEEVIRERFQLRGALKKFKSIKKVHDSHANFLLVEVPNAREVSSSLFCNNILVKLLEPTKSGHLQSHLRITVGREQDNRDLLFFLQEALRSD